MHAHLLEQARHLATLDQRRPRQANLRRAVSSAYYALFHFFVDQACREVWGSQRESAPFRQVLARAFQHGVMRSACQSFAGGTLKSSVARSLPASFTIGSTLQSIAESFVNCQEWRHSADYDLSVRFRRSEVLSMLFEVESAIAAFEVLPDATQRRFFLTCLLTWNTLAGR